MEKETVKAFDFEAAFKALDEIEMPILTRTGSRVKANRVNLRERFSSKPGHDTLVEEYFDVNNVDELEAAKDERDAEVAKAKLARIEKIVDLEAESEEDILPSYVGKLIMQCPQCMTLFYKNEADIEQSNENPGVVNINEPCQHCGNTSGYSLIGKVGGISEDEADNFDLDSAEVTEDELDLEFPEGTEEVDAEGTGDGADAMTDDEELSLDLEIEENEEGEEEPVEESLHGSDAIKDAKKHGELATEHESDFKTLNESVLDDDLDTELKAHNDYIEYLKDELTAEEKALTAAKNEEIVAAITRKIAALKADLEAALPEAVKAAVDITADVVEDEAEAEAETEIETAEEVVDESLNNSEMLADAQKHSELATDNASEKTSLNENIEEGIGDVIKKFKDRPASILTQQYWEDALIDTELQLGRDDLSPRKRASLEKRLKEIEDKFAKQRALEKRLEAETEAKMASEATSDDRISENLADNVTDAEVDKVLDKLWSEEQPTEAEIEAILDSPRFEGDLTTAEDFDEKSFDKHLTEYFTNVYSNVDTFNCTACAINGRQLVVEGCIKFKSGKNKDTKFIFESTDRGLVGKNTDFSATEAFRLSTKLRNKVLYTEGIKYRYSIGESLVRGNTKNK